MSDTESTPMQTFDFVPEADVDRTGVTQRQLMWDQYVGAPMKIVWNDWRGKLSLVLILFYGLLGTLGPVLVPVPAIQAGKQYVSPFQSLENPLGTDMIGRDFLALIIHATPAMLQMVVAGALFTTVVATVIGTVAGYKGGRVDTVMMTFTDIAMTIPGLPLVVVLAAVIQPESPAFVGIILAINAWAGLARALRSEILTIRDEGYVEASRTMGLSTATIVRWNLLPSLMPYILIRFANAVRNIIFGSVGLYFLGVLPFSHLNWGVMLNEAYNQGAMFSLGRAHTIIIPIVVITLFIYAFVIFAQATDRVFNPRVRARHEETAAESAQTPTP